MHQKIEHIEHCIKDLVGWTFVIHLELFSTHFISNQKNNSSFSYTKH